MTYQFQWVAPDDLRDQAESLEAQLAGLKLILAAVDGGAIVMLGDGPNGEVRFTSLDERETPFAKEMVNPW